MTDNNSMLNTGELAKPATLLVEKISNAIGTLYEPTRIIKMAEAKAEANKIEALAKIEISDIEQRGLHRLIYQEGKKQENIEDITAQAINQLAFDSRVEDLEEDWITHFFKNCETVSDKEMQSLWARILSGEASKSGSFSKRTIDCVASLSKEEAKSFTNLCQFTWLEQREILIILNSSHEIYNKHEINFETLSHLATCNLISFNSTINNTLQYSANTVLSYYDRPTFIEFPNGVKKEISCGEVIFTKMGEELAPICGSRKNDEFYNYVIKDWITKGFILSSPLLSDCFSK